MYIILILVLIIILILLHHSCKVSSKENLEFRENISSKTNLSDCDNVKVFSLSTGLIMDSQILCESFKHTKGKLPTIHIENVDNVSMPRDWILVNIDHTHFQIDGDTRTLKYKHGPKNLMCKTKQCFDILSDLNKDNDFNIVHTGFTSVDKLDKTYQKDYKKFIHIAGKSPYKNTIQLVDIWKKHSDWPKITVVCREKSMLPILKKGISSVKNIDIIETFVTNKKLSELYNNHSVHVCLSAHEGFGHYIYEAMSAEAVVLYGDVPPTNEWFNHMENGIGVNMKNNGVVNNICPRYEINEDDLVIKMKHIISLSHKELRRIGVNARKTYVKQKSEFLKNIKRLFQIGSIPKIIHSVWLDKVDMLENIEYPERYKQYKHNWINNHKDYTFMYWSGETILKLIEKVFPEYVEVYKEFPLMIKCDFARFVILYVIGGVYVDMDIGCRSNIDSILTNDTYFVLESKQHLQTYQEHHDKDCKGLITNGMVASIQKHPFILGWIRKIVDNYKHFEKDNIMKISGPHGLYDFYESSPHQIFIGNTCSISYINKDTLQIEDECKGYHNNPVLIHWWNGTEWGQNDKIDNKIVKPFIFVDVNHDSIVNPMIWEENKKSPELEISRYIVDQLVELPSSYSCVCIGAQYGEISVPISFMLYTLGSHNKVYSIEPNKDKCDFIEKVSLLNSLSNSVILHKGVSMQESYFKKQKSRYIMNSYDEWSKLSDMVLFNTLDSFHPSTIKHIRCLVITTPMGDIFNVLNSSKKIIMLFQPIIVLKYRCLDDCTELQEFLEEQISPPYKVEQKLGKYMICVQDSG